MPVAAPHVRLAPRSTLRREPASCHPQHLPVSALAGGVRHDPLPCVQGLAQAFPLASLPVALRWAYLFSAHDLRSMPLLSSLCSDEPALEPVPEYTPPSVSLLNPHRQAQGWLAWELLLRHLARRSDGRPVP